MQRDGTISRKASLAQTALLVMFLRRAFQVLDYQRLDFFVSWEGAKTQRSERGELGGRCMRGSMRRGIRFSRTELEAGLWRLAVTRIG